MPRPYHITLRQRSHARIIGLRRKINLLPIPEDVKEKTIKLTYCLFDNVRIPYLVVNQTIEPSMEYCSGTVHSPSRMIFLSENVPLAIRRYLALFWHLVTHECQEAVNPLTAAAYRLDELIPNKLKQPVWHFMARHMEDLQNFSGAENFVIRDKRHLKWIMAAAHLTNSLAKRGTHPNQSAPRKP